MPHWIRVYVVPAAVFQAVLIGGGYGTGREAAEFVTQAGPVGGIVAVGFFFLALTLVLMASFEFARTFQTYDYRHFFQQLLGSAWWLYEGLAVLLFVLGLAVVISASSTMALDWFGIPVLYTSIGIIIVTAVVLSIGQAAVEGLLTVWAGLFSVFLIVIVIITLNHQGSGPGDGDWSMWSSAKGFQYASYNMAAIPVLLYTLKSLESRKEALLAALITGIAGALPALLMHIVLSEHLPDILSEALPMMRLIESLNQPWIAYVYAFLLIGTIVQTAIGALEGVVQRIDGLRTDRGRALLSSLARAILGALVLMVASYASTIGVVTLIGSGYGTLAWGFMVVYAIPAVTIGVWKIRQTSVQP